MAKKKRKKKGKLIYVGRGFKYLGLGIYYSFKGIYLGGKWLIKKTRKSKEKLEEKRLEKKRPKTQAKYERFLELKKLKGNFAHFEKKLISQNIVGIILGARGTGKSAMGMKLLENFKTKTNKKVYALGFKAGDLPRWIKVVKGVDEIGNNSVILIDEGGIEFSSRRAMSSANKLLSDLLLISRHKDLSVLFISQSSANLEINALRQSDFLILKPSSLLQLDFERKKIKEIYEEVKEGFEEFKEDKGLAYVYSGEYCGFISNKLPGFWGEGVSKGYANK